MLGEAKNIKDQIISLDSNENWVQIEPNECGIYLLQLDKNDGVFCCGILFKTPSHYYVITDPEQFYSLSSYIEYATFSTKGLGFRTKTAGVSYKLMLRRLL